jgi:hypothetical protein
MPKHAISLTLEADNLLWLRSRAAATKTRSLSRAVDELVTEARLAGRLPSEAMRSVVGTIDLGADDPGLDAADAYIRSLFDQSARQPVLVRETAPAPGRQTRKGRRG